MGWGNFIRYLHDTIFPLVIVSFVRDSLRKPLRRQPLPWTTDCLLPPLDKSVTEGRRQWTWQVSGSNFLFSAHRDHPFGILYTILKFQDLTNTSLSNQRTFGDFLYGFKTILQLKENQPRVRLNITDSFKREILLNTSIHTYWFHERPESTLTYDIVY